MLNDPTLRLRAQLSILRDLAKEYSGRTIDNVIQGLEARVKHYEQKKDKMQNQDRLPHQGHI